MEKIIALVTLGVALVAATSEDSYYQPNGYGSAYDRTDEKRDFYVPPHYAYEYKVHDPHTGDVKSQAEERRGDVVKGYYTLKEADGTIREVHYTADKHRGFQAEVRKKGQAYHPQYTNQGSFNY